MYGQVWHLKPTLALHATTLETFGTAPLEDKHSKSNTAEGLEEVAARFENSPSKIIANVHDNDANIVAAANIL